MFNLYPMLAAGAGDEDDDYRICYGIVVACVSLLLFCVLVASVSVAKACAITAMIVIFFAFIGWFAPRRVAAERARGLETQQQQGAATGAAGAGTQAVRVHRCACGLAEVAINALPTFTYECPLKGEDKPAGCVLCSVCLEDIQGGQVVRQLPACRHLFHVECIDMWLHAHRTCPLCRCDLLPHGAAGKATASAESSDADALPPV